MGRQDAKDAKPEPEPVVDSLAHAVIGSAIEVHRRLGPGFLEVIYEEALCVELRHRNLPFQRQPTFHITYRGTTIAKHRIDLIVGHLIVVELKSVDTLAPVHTAQVLSYLRTTRCKLGLLLNFNVPVMAQGIRRVISSE